MERRRTRAAGWSRRFGVLLRRAASDLRPLSHRYGLLETLALLLGAGRRLRLRGLRLMMGVYAFTRLWHYGDLGGWDLTVGSMTGLVVLVPFMLFAYCGCTLPDAHRRFDRYGRSAGH